MVRGTKGECQHGIFRMRNGPDCTGCSPGLFLPEVNPEGHTGSSARPESDAFERPQLGAAVLCRSAKIPLCQRGTKGECRRRIFPDAERARLQRVQSRSISAGSKSGAEHRHLRPTEASRSSGSISASDAVRGAPRKIPLCQRGTKGECQRRIFPDAERARLHPVQSRSISAGSKSGAEHRKNPSVRGYCSPGSDGRAP